jgi:acyl carrier protein
VNRIEIINQLRTWLVEKDANLRVNDITEETPIVEQRILSSLQVVSLLLHIEQMRGAPIEISSLRPGMFHSLSAIYQHFFADAAHA